jgi:type I restriction enzyme, S subunit
LKIEINRDLPKSWILTTVGEIAEYVQRGKSPKYIDWSELPVVNQKCIRWDGINSEYLKFIHPEQWDKWSKERFLQEGDILWNSTGTGTIGRATIYRGLPEYQQAVVDIHVTIVRTKNYNQKLLHYWIMSPVIQLKIDRMYTGSTNQVELSKSEVISTSLPLPPLNEQKRIVTKIEALQTKSTAAKQQRQGKTHKMP